MERRYGYKYGIHANANMPVWKGLNIVHGDGAFLNCQSIGVYTGAVVTGNITLHSVVL